MTCIIYVYSNWTNMSNVIILTWTTRFFSWPYQARFLMKITCSCPVHCTAHIVLGNGDVCCFGSSLSLNLFSRLGMIMCCQNHSCQPHGGTTFKVRNHLSHEWMTEFTSWMSAQKYEVIIWDVFWYFINQTIPSSLGRKRFLFIREIFSICSLFIYTFFN